MTIKNFKELFLSRQILLFLVIIILALIILPQLSAFSGSLEKISNLDFSLALLAFALIMGTYFAGAATYYFLSRKPLRYLLTVVIQFAAMFVNRVLPAGIGAIGVNFGYLKRFGHSNIQSATIVGLNNLLGFVGNSIIILLVLLLSGIALPSNSSVKGSWLYLLILVPGIIVLMYFTINKKIKIKLYKSMQNIKALLLAYADSPVIILKALLSSMTLTILHMLCLMASMYAIGGSVSLAVVVLVFSLGVGAGASVPTPGGLGGLEAGMVAGFIAFGMPANTALAGVLLYRIISFWIPLIIGGAAFVYAQSQGYIRFKNPKKL